MGPSKKRAGVRSRRLRRPSGRKSKKSKKSKKAGGNSLQLQAARSKPRSTCRGDSDYSCALNVMNYLGLMKTQVANFLKQQGRISAFSKTGGKKDGKKGIFAATAQRIIRSGGGNSAALSCQGSTTSNGAKNLTALAPLLNGCEAKVKTACSTENMPTPNMTVVSSCNSSMHEFKAMVDTCAALKDNGTAACACWSNSNFTALEKAVRSSDCKLKDSQTAMNTQLKSYKTTFSACKQAEDDGMKAMSSCSTSKADLLASAATLTANSAGLDSAKTKVDSLANSTRFNPASSCSKLRGDHHHRHRDQNHCRCKPRELYGSTPDNENHLCGFDCHLHRC